MDEPKDGEQSPPIQHESRAVDLTIQTPGILASGGSGSRTPPPPPPPEEPDEEEGMLRMSFLEHLEELRSRLIKMILGFIVTFVLCLIFADKLWLIVQAPAKSALDKLHQGSLVAVSVMEQFSIIYIWVPVVASIFVASPWIVYQVWAFISPGLYKRERRWAIPFVVTTAGLFIAGGMFAYFVAFRYALVFLLSIGSFAGVQNMISIEGYFDLFVDVMLGVSLIFELPVVIFFLTLLRVLSPRWLLKNSRYAILVITILAAVVTPTPDAFNMMLFAVPMVGLYFVGLFASFLLVMHREGRHLPWKAIFMWSALVIVLLAAFGYFEITHYHLHVIRHWPFLAK
jgi:sec-independent protein translocase protein TatC